MNSKKNKPKVGQYYINFKHSIIYEVLEVKKNKVILESTFYSSRYNKQKARLSMSFDEFINGAYNEDAVLVNELQKFIFDKMTE